MWAVIVSNPHIFLRVALTYSIWMSQINCWLSLIRKRAIKRDSVHNMTDFERKNTVLCDHYNDPSEPFVWVTITDLSVERCERPRKRVNGTEYRLDTRTESSAKSRLTSSYLLGMLESKGMTTRLLILP